MLTLNLTNEHSGHDERNDYFVATPAPGKKLSANEFTRRKVFGKEGFRVSGFSEIQEH
jgi:hypothetical protein